jgi:hypothetical protein
MNIFTLFKQWWWKHRCEFAINVLGCLKPDCPHEPARIAARNRLPKVVPPGPPKMGGIGRYYSESTWTEVLVNGKPQLMVNGSITIKGSKDTQQIQMGHLGSISVQSGGSVTISVNNTNNESNVRIEGDGEVFMLSQKRGS